MSKLEMLDMLCFIAEFGMRTFREMRMSEQICHLKLTHPYCKGPENIYFTNTVRNKFMRDALASLKSTVIALLCTGTCGH